MNPPSTIRRAHLPRLAAEYYRGRAFVHWTMTIDGRKTGWLTLDFHHRFRLLLLHVLARHHLTCPAYCLMPDHVHLIWAGLRDASDQRRAAAFLRRHLNHLLHPWRLQGQAFDHVLRARERASDALAAIVGYLLQNPVRAGLCAQWQDYPYSSALVAGYPDLDLRHDRFWRVFWHAFGAMSVSD